MRNDPYWTVARFAGVDMKGTPFAKGARLFWYPSSRRALTGAAADQASRDFDAACSDEGGGW